MIALLKKRLNLKIKCENGAIDKVLVTLLMVIIAVAALVSLENWSSSQKEGLVNKSDEVITNVLNE